MSTISIITGITGQDGAYLAKLLLGKGHRVIGVVRPGQTRYPIHGLEYLNIDRQVSLVECDLCSTTEFRALLGSIKPQEVYNLAGQSSVKRSFDNPSETLAFNYNSVLNMLEVIRLEAPHIHFYQASSSEMFGDIPNLPLREDMSFNPVSPYAASKAAAHFIAKNYRTAYGLFISCGILFNHESYLRPQHFFVKKIITEALEVAAGKRQTIRVGNLAARRDLGYAPRYVETMYLMLQQDKPDDFLICSGQSVELSEIAHYICDKTGIDRDVLKSDPALYRPLDIPDIYGDNRKAKRELGWEYDMSFFDVLDLLIDEEMKNRDGAAGRV